jgi:hypothetical protein
MESPILLLLLGKKGSMLSGGVRARLSDQALQAVRTTVRLIRRSEREDEDPRACSDAQLSALELLFRQLPAQDLQAVIRRHRLECFLQRDPLTARLMPKLMAIIRFHARQETLAALALVSLLREIGTLFEQAGIPLLIFKGIPLALQTTGLLSSRGSGDVDMLVHPRQLVAAVELLEAAGFARSPGQFPQRLESLSGRYGRWAYKELSLTRSGPAGIQRLDLHWALSNVRGPLPGFEEAWERRETLRTQGLRIGTLCRVHAFEHACFHAAVDQWNSLRHLIDIDRLASLLPESSLAALSGRAAVQCSCAVTFDLSGSQRLLIVAKGAAARREARLLARISTRTRSAVQQARLSQALPTSREAIPWSLRQWWSNVWRQATLSPDWRDWLRVFCFSVIWPGAFSDPVTGQDRDWRGLLQARFTRLVQKFRRT